MRPFSTSFPISFGHAFYSYAIAVGRIGIFAWGSSVQGSVLFMPNDAAVTLLIILIVLTALPRMVFPEFWKRGKNGADLVVFETHEF